MISENVSTNIRQYDRSCEKRRTIQSYMPCEVPDFRV